jgi:hypothetical protein
MRKSEHVHEAFRSYSPLPLLSPIAMCLAIDVGILGPGGVVGQSRPWRGNGNQQDFDAYCVLRVTLPRSQSRLFSNAQTKFVISQSVLHVLLSPLRYGIPTLFFRCSQCKMYKNSWINIYYFFHLTVSRITLPAPSEHHQCP